VVGGSRRCAGWNLLGGKRGLGERDYGGKDGQGKRGEDGTREEGKRPAQFSLLSSAFLRPASLDPTSTPKVKNQSKEEESTHDTNTPHQETRSPQQANCPAPSFPSTPTKSPAPAASPGWPPLSGSAHAAWPVRPEICCRAWDRRGLDLEEGGEGGSWRGRASFEDGGGDRLLDGESGGGGR
jgi:hypothetical protein